jgi:two-component system sensor histidine kinase TctE
LRKPSDISIRRQLLSWLLVPLGLLWVLSAAVTFVLAESYADEVYDDQLLNSADSVVGRLRNKSTGLDVDLPPTAIAMLRHNFKDKFYFQIISFDGKMIDGDAVLPIPASLTDRPLPAFGDGVVAGDRVRTLLLDAEVEETPSKHVFVQVAETLESRKMLARHVLTNTIMSQLVVIVLGAAAVWFGVTRGLSRLEVLRNDVSSRSQRDLSPIDESRAPLEVRPLVHAINDLLQLLREDLEAKQRFVANAAHQMRTPLAGLKTYIGLLKKMVSNENAVEVLNQLDAGADRTTHLVNRLLALAKAEPNAFNQAAFKLVDLNEVVSETAASLVPEAVNKNIDLAFVASDEPAIIMADPANLHELVVNIIENAVRYTQEGGTVTVSILNGETVGLAVEDNGPGIPQEERERVFERFYRILGTGISGSGLGLSIVNEIARSHNARVILGPGAEGVGTRVQVEFIKAQPGIAASPANLSVKQES